jgi:hypothetical protein
MMVFGPLVMLVTFAVVVLGVVVASRFAAGGTAQRSIGPGCMGRSRTTPGRPPSGLEAPKAAADPLEIVRERYARGEIDHNELERYLDHLLRSERPHRAVADPPR